MKIDTIITGLFLFTLVVVGNYIGELLGCSTQHLLNTNIYVKHFFGILTLYFPVGFISSYEDNEHPINTLMITILIYILFLLFTKMNIVFTVIVFFIFMIIYILGDYIKYYNYTNNKIIVKKLKLIQQILFYAMIVLILIGFTTYFIKQYKEHHKNWSTLKFIFGTQKCKSVN